jgi:DNA replicative helicase MCM subunit Mcm2 (Cdc46/Mcm family)
MAFELIKDALKQSATDPTTGMIDMDVIVTGHTSSSRKRVELLVNMLKDLFKSNQSDYVGKNWTFDRLQPQILANWTLEDFSNKPKEE